MIDRDEMIKRQQVLADFGEFALRSDKLDEVLIEACRLVGDVLGTHRAKILEVEENGQSLLVRAGVGWKADIVGRLRIPMNERSSETFSIQERTPIITQDIRKEERFKIPEFMREAGVIALANVPILLPGNQAYGLLQVDATEPREFEHEDTEFLRTYAIILGPVIDRLHKVHQLRSSEERFRLIVENARDYAIFTTDAQDRISHWLPGAEAVYGWTEDEAIGQPGSLVFTPEDRQMSEDKKEFHTARTEGAAPDVRWHLRKDGTRVFIEGTVRALYGDDGRLRGFLKIGQDVTERRRADERLRASEERFRQFGDASSDILWMRDAETLHWIYLTPAFETIYGMSRDEALTGNDAHRWVDLILPEDREQVLDAMRRVRESESLTFEFRIRRASDGEVRWIRNTDFPLLDEGGQVKTIGGVGQDITEQKATADRLEVLVRELQHRTRNLLGVVRSLADKTLAGSTSLREFQLRFRDRLAALSRMNSLLSRLKEGDRVTFDELLRAELSAHGAIDDGDEGEQVSLDGPVGVRLRSSTVQTFALALHELATNASKYGALATPEGHLTVRWHVQYFNEEKRLYVDWWESGVTEMPEPEAPPRGGGYGRQLIEKALPYQLNAEIIYELRTGGVRCRIILPVAADNPKVESA